MTGLTLYQFPISHFCEKVRWTLDYKGLKYDRHNLLLGFHRKPALRLASNTHVPILVHDEMVVQNSGDIITYLDSAFPHRPLTPAAPEPRREALEWEAYLDEEVGVHLRRYAYHVLLESPELLIPVLCQGGPWYAKPLYKLVFPTLRKRIRAVLKITERTAAASRRRVEDAAARIAKRLRERPFLVGEGFTRADLSAAALLAPLCRPEKFGLQWPATYPQPLASLADTCAGTLEWAQQVYRDYR